MNRVVGTLCLMLVIYTVFYTPEWLSHWSWFMQVRRTYCRDGEQGFRVVSYNHVWSDGMRIAERLANRTVTMSRTLTPISQCDFWTCVRLRSTSSENASPFVQLIACIVRRLARFRSRDITVGVLVGTRHLLSMDRRDSPGSFVRTAISTHRRKSQHDVAQCISESIDSVRTQSRLHDTFAERLRCLQCDVVCNKWMLGRIQPDDAPSMQLYHGGRHVTLDFIVKYVSGPLEMKFIPPHSTSDRWTILVSRIRYV